MNKANKTNIFLILIIIALCLYNVQILLKTFEQEKKSTPQESNIEARNPNLTSADIEENERQRSIERLKDMDERTRLQEYCGKYINYIEKKEYEKAYDLLYSEFKNNYFKTLEDFEKYVKEKYPEVISIKYNDISRHGEYYILAIKILDLKEAKKEFEQNIVIRENNFDDFELSFNVE